MFDMHTDVSPTGDTLAGGGSTTTASAEDASIALLDTLSQGIAAVVDKIGPAVVRVETRGRSSGGLGSGVIISPDGLILTNSHAVNGHRDVRLTDSEGRIMEAGCSAKTATPTCPAARDRARQLPRRLGTKLLRRGQLVIAIGNPLG
jgi:S1-C subfamily serine protease